MLVVDDGRLRPETAEEFRQRMADRIAETRRRRELDEEAARSQQAAAMRRTTAARKAADAAPPTQETPAPPVAASVPVPVVQDRTPAVSVVTPTPPAPRARPADPTPVAARPVPRPPVQRPAVVSPADRVRLAAITAVVQGDPVAQVAARHFVAESTLYNWLKAAGHARSQTRPSLDPAVVVAAYEAGATAAELAEQHQVTAHWIRKVLAKQGVQLREVAMPRPPKSKLAPHRDSIVAAYEGGATIPQLAAEHEVTPWTVRRALDRWGVQRRPDDRPTHSGAHPKTVEEYPPDLVRAVVDAYINSGMTLLQIAATVPGVTSVKLVQSILAKTNTKTRPPASAMRHTPAEHDALLAQIDTLLDQGLTHAQIGKQLGYAQSTVSRWLRARNAARAAAITIREAAVYSREQDAWVPVNPAIAEAISAGTVEGLSYAAPPEPAPISTPPDVAPEPDEQPLEPAARAPDASVAAARAAAVAIVSNLLDAAAALAAVAHEVHPLIDAATDALAHLTREQP